MVTTLSKLMVLLCLITSLFLAAYSMVSTTTYGRDDLHGQITELKRLNARLESENVELSTKKTQVESQLDDRKTREAEKLADRESQHKGAPKPTKDLIDQEIVSINNEIQHLQELERIAKGEYAEEADKVTALEEQLVMAREKLNTTETEIVSKKDEFYQMLAKAMAARIRAEALAAQIEKKSAPPAASPSAPAAEASDNAGPALQ